MSHSWRISASVGTYQPAESHSRRQAANPSKRNTRSSEVLSMGRRQRESFGRGSDRHRRPPVPDPDEAVPCLPFRTIVSVLVKGLLATTLAPPMLGRDRRMLMFRCRNSAHRGIVLSSKIGRSGLFAAYSPHCNKRNRPPSWRLSCSWSPVPDLNLTRQYNPSGLFL